MKHLTRRERMWTCLCRVVAFSVIAMAATASELVAQEEDRLHLGKGLKDQQPGEPRSPLPPKQTTIEDGAVCTIIDFEGIGNLNSIPEFDGITSPDWLSIIDQDAGGTGNIAHEPSPSTVAFWLGGSPGSRDILISDPASRLEFFYTSFVTVTLEAFDQNNNMVASASGPPNFNQGPGGDPNGTFNKWDPLEVRSGNTDIVRVSVSGNVNQTGIDDLKVCRNLRIDSLEVTQAIQEIQDLDDLKNDLQGDREPPVPIIAGKPAVLRIYLQQVQTTTTLRAQVEIPGVLNQTRSLRQQPQCDPLKQRRNEGGCRSLDFHFIPPEGNWTAAVRLLTDSGDELESHELPMRGREADALVLRSVSVCDSVDAMGVWQCGRASVLGSLIGFLRATAPTDKVSVSATNNVVYNDRGPYDVDGDGIFEDTQDEARRWKRDTAAMIHGLYGIWDRFLGLFGTERYYYGMARTSVPHLGGIAAGIPSRGAFSKESLTVLNTPFGDQVVAHETGHMLGRKHTGLGNPPAMNNTPPGCFATAPTSSPMWPFSDNTIQSGNGPEIGFDLSRNRPILPEVHFDWMSYCVPFWISPFTYRGANGPLKAEAVTDQGELGLFWVVSGNLEETTVGLEPLLELETRGPTEVGTGDYSVEVRSSTGEILAERRFDPQSAVLESSDVEEEGSPFFLELLPVQADAVAIAVVDPSGQDLGVLQLSSGTAPSVTLLEPVAGDFLSGNEMIRWSISDPDSTEFWSVVDYTVDDGETWSRLGSITEEDFLSVNFDQIAGADNARLRITVSDGIQSSSVLSPLFQVARKNPTVEIFSPKPGVVFAEKDMVWLQANAYDADDGFLDEDTVRWSSNLAGPVGVGASLPITTLSPGIHAINVDVTDSDGNIASDTITVRVAGEAPNLDLVVNKRDELPTTCVDVTIDAQPGSLSADLASVEYSLDGGSNWIDVPIDSLPFIFTVPGAGFFHLVARVFDEAGQVDVQDERFFIDSPCDTPVEPMDCSDDSDTICLNNSRFIVEVNWQDFDGNQGSGRVVPFRSDDSGLFYFFDADNWELLVKVLDGCGINDRFWVFAAATTNVEVTLNVTDTLTNATRSYFNPLGNAAAALTDTDAFATCTAASSASVSTTSVVREFVSELMVGHLAEPLDFLKGDCTPTDTTLCLNDGRFAVELEWRDFAGNTGSGNLVPFGSNDSGLMWFFDADNWELLVKVLNGCGINNRFWVFGAATTNVEYTLRVTDTDNGAVSEYFNPLGVSSAAITDTDAFATCP